LAYENQYSVVFDDSLDCACVGTDFYEYDIALRSWKGWEKLEGIGEAPANRAGMGLALSSEKMFIFGGYRGSYLNDLVEYDINGSSWKDLSPMSAGVAPSVRANMGFEEWNGKLYLFGGQNVLGMLDSFFVYDIALATWTDLSSPRNGTSPTPRSYMGFTKWNSKFYVFGGFDGLAHLSDLHEYDIASGTWVDLSTPRTGYSPPRGVMFTDEKGLAQSNGKLFVFGSHKNRVYGGMVAPSNDVLLFLA